MTEKDKIYAMILETRNRINAIKGESRHYDIQKNIECGNAGKQSLKSLKNELEIAQRCLYGVQIADRIKAWELTSKGKETIHLASERLKQARMEVNNKKMETGTAIQSFLDSSIKGNWHITNLGFNSARLSLYDDSGEALSSNYDVNVYYDYETVMGDNRFEIGYTGLSLDPISEIDHQTYFLGLSQLCKKENAEYLRDILFDFAKFKENADSDIRLQKDILEHPENYDPDFFNDIKKEWI